MMEDVRRWLIESGLTERPSEYLIEAAEVLGVAVLAFIANKITRSVILRLVQQVAKRTSTDWDDIIVKRRVFHRLAHLAPAIVIYMMAPLVITTPQLTVLFERAAQVYMLLAGLLVMDAILTSVNDIYESFDVARRIPILGYLQVVKIIISIMVAIFAISIIIDKSVLVLLTGLGALTAIILLIFKDSILGLVAGIQLVANDMVRPGDWIEMQKYGADGDVIQITLNTVKIRNWDKTITTIPTYSLISDSFKNWRGMSESGGRRIKRALPIDMTSVKFCTPEMIDRFSRIAMLRDHIERKTKELREYNERNEIDQSVPVNGRRMTNLGTFRAYLVAYLRAHPKIHQDMTFLVRQLPPSDKGLPLEIYVFSNDQVWANYEAIQADIFDHLLASLPEFELRPFQSPTGDDVRNSIFAAAG